MSSNPAGLSSRPTVLVLGTLIVLAGLAAVGVAVIHRDNNNSPLASVVTPAPAGPPTPVAAEDTTACAGKSFGPYLGPLNPPSDVHTYSAEPAMTIDTSKLYRADIVTAKGDIFVCLEPNLAPHSVNVFVTLARNGFYDGLVFHRVVTGFVIQGGDPAGTGSGGPGFKFNDEPVKGKYVAGAVAMANSGPNTNGSQYFIDTADDTGSLQPLYNLFGHVESGLGRAQSIAKGDAMIHIYIQQQQ